MAIIKAVNSRASIGNAVNYVAKKEKTEERLVSGIGCNPATAIDEMKATKAIWDKTEGRQYKHMIQSFPAEEKITAQQAHEIAKQLCETQFPGYEVLIATHRDKKHIHSHMIINSVSYEDGRKFQQSAADLQAIKDRSDELCREHGLSIAQKNNEITSNKQGKYKALEKGIDENGKYKSYLWDCYHAVTSTKKKAKSREEFIEVMKVSGWETTWTDSRKHITFTNDEGQKVRASNLEKTFKEPFGKEDLERGFEREATRARAERAIEQSRRNEAYTDPDGTIGTDRTGEVESILGKLEATIRESRAAVEADEQRRADRIAEEQSRQRERDRATEQRTAPERQRSRDYER